MKDAHAIEGVFDLDLKGRLLRPWLVIGCFFYAIFSVAYIDFMAETRVGLLVSLVLFTLVCCLAIWKPAYGVMAILLLFFTVPWFPRDVLSSYFELQVAKSKQFNTITSISLFGVPLLYLATYFTVCAIFLKNIGMKAIGRRNLLIVIFFISLLILNSLLFYSFGNEFDPSKFKEWLYYILLIPSGYVFYYYLLSKFGLVRLIEVLCSFFLAVTLILALRVPMFVLSDISKGSFSLDLSIYPHLSMAVILGLVVAASSMQSAKNSIKTFFLIGLLAFSILSPSRGFFVILFVSMAILVVTTRERWNVFKWHGLFLLVLALPLMFILASSPDLFDFFVWKAEILTSGDVSDSGRLREYEFTNILHEALNNPMYLLIGEGPSGFFTFSYEQLPREIYEILTFDSYSEAELNSDKYYNPHFFVNVLLLKFGIIGLFMYCFFITLNWYRSAKLIRGNLINYPIIRFYLVVNFVLCFSMYFEMFWRPYYLLLFVINYFVIRSIIKKGLTNAAP